MFLNVGFGKGAEDSEWHKIPQYGNICLNTSTFVIDSPQLGKTKVGRSICHMLVVQESEEEASEMAFCCVKFSVNICNGISVVSSEDFGGKLILKS